MKELRNISLAFLCLMLIPVYLTGVVLLVIAFLAFWTGHFLVTRFWSFITNVPCSTGYIHYK